MKIAILGAGMVGKTMAIDLCEMHNVTSFDISSNSLEQLKLKNSTINTVKADLSDFSNYATLLHDFDYVITAVPGFMGYKALEAVINAKKNVADISFFPEDAFALDNLAKENNVTAIVDCGVAPGMSNYILGYHNSSINIEDFECMVGGLPKHRVKPFEYKAPFSPIDVIEEYTRPARLMVNGKIVTKPALTEVEYIDFDQVGTLEAFNTDGLRSLLFTMNIPNMREKTLRYPGHTNLIKSLIKGGFFSTEKISFNGMEISPLDFSSAVLINQWKSKPDEEEFTIMRIKLTGKDKNQKQTTFIYDLFDTNDTITQTSSMSRTTGFTCTATLNLIMNGMFTKKGVFPPENVGCYPNCFNFVMQYLKDRNVHYKVTTI